MPLEGSELLICYNKGCGNKFHPSDNKEDSCTFHPGNPVFHDAYKSWSCCNKKSTDFTEFLNIKGCKKSYHSNVKPPQPPKPAVDNSKANEAIKSAAPISKPSPLVRPPFDAPLVKLTPEISNQLKSQIENLASVKKGNGACGEITVGTNCKNRGCKASFEGSKLDYGECIYHPGVPVFHEGLKSWSCCKKKTTDFGAFLEQVGCEKGSHVWIQEKSENAEKTCNYDWHQTGSQVVISIYAKKYNPNDSTVEINPIRVKISISFPEDDSFFHKDLELFGIVNVDKSQVRMLQTKVEIELKKAEPCNWPKLEVPPSAAAKVKENDRKIQEPPSQPPERCETVDLSDIK